MTQTKPFSFAERMGNIPESFIREILKVATQPDMISFAGGLPNPKFFPSEKIAAAAEKVLTKDGSIVLQYAPTEGYLPLRDFIAHRESAKGGHKLSAEDILILNGSQQGLDLMGKLFLNRHTGLMLEAPSYLGAIQSFSAYEPSFHEISLEEGGPVLEQFDRSIKTYNPALFYCIPNFQNPTGNTYDMHHRTTIAEIVRNSDVTIIEDNPYGEIYFEDHGLPDLHALLPSHTVKLGSFSKIISPGLRLGWATGPQAVIRKMIVAKQASDLHSSNLGQRILYQFLLDNNLDEHLAGIRQFYAAQAARMNALMTTLFPKVVTWTQPKGGMFLWITLPENADASMLLTRAMAAGVLFVPGENFYATKSQAKNTIRINFSNPSEEQMKQGISILGSQIHEALGLK